MISNEQYVRQSLELNLFFLRIVKEHAIFAAASVPAKDARISSQFVLMSRNLGRLLSRTIALSRGNISREVMVSGELVTPRTLPSERAVTMLTGIPIDTSITARELSLGFRDYYERQPNIVNSVSILNRQIIAEVNSGIAFQNSVLSKILSCKAFSSIYPHNLEHVIREAREYVNTLVKIQSRQGEDTSPEGMAKQEIFWNDIMEEHSKFIRGYLDPSQNNLFNIANNFANEFDQLNTATKTLAGNPGNLPQITQRSYTLVTQLRDFKIQGTQGLLACKIKAIMPALLADHVTREANHYLRVLRK